MTASGGAINLSSGSNEFNIGGGKDGVLKITGAGLQLEGSPYIITPTSGGLTLNGGLTISRTNNSNNDLNILSSTASYSNTNLTTIEQCAKTIKLKNEYPHPSGSGVYCDSYISLNEDYSITLQSYKSGVGATIVNVEPTGIRMQNGIIIYSNSSDSSEIKDSNSLNGTINVANDSNNTFTSYTHNNSSGYYYVNINIGGTVTAASSSLSSANLKISFILDNSSIFSVSTSVGLTYSSSSKDSEGNTVYNYKINATSYKYTSSSISLTKGKTYTLSVTTTSLLYTISSTSKVASLTVKRIVDNSTVLIGTTHDRQIFRGTTNIGCGSYSAAAAITLGCSGAPYVYLTTPSTTFTAASDRRDKADFKTIDNSLNFINQLQPVTFVDNHREKYTSYDDENNKYFNEELYNNQTLKGNRRIAGFIAQDVYKSLIDVYNDDNYASVVDYSKYDDPDCDIDRYYMRYTQIIPFLTGAIQELTKKIETLESRITELENK